ncbi:phosphoenolpyruvate carboxylase [Moritella sp. PE36]|uniref:phosphoenolpyruvate carboxylase n=1 Tax=Moritella sp. PE36 TaxID=58051 RepID=UPI00015698DE|nr:phosphoenolpyruvate carboxylase [Moritella sp. PE36]EDM65177.1 phosphoenolpyruvate carboxylase [Moritella sp. PE36]
MSDKYAALRSNVGLLGQVLGNTIKDHLGEEFLDKIETIRQLAKSSRAGSDKDRAQLLTVLRNLSDDELLPVARAFSQFLNLANIAEQFHTTSRNCADNVCVPDSIDELFAKLNNSEISEEDVLAAVKNLKIDLVLTAHPTEITRRTLIHKHGAINKCLSQLELTELSSQERDVFMTRIEQLVSQAWHTNEIRTVRPTPVDEAKWGFAVVENSLWDAVPNFLRSLDKRLQDRLDYQLPIDAAPVKFTSWMGGDRDGNPFVTSTVTEEVLLTSRWMAIHLFLKDVTHLSSELSMNNCDDRLRALVGESHEPYRVLLKKLRNELTETLASLTAQLKGEHTQSRDIITTTAQLREPLLACYNSLNACGMRVIAKGALLDTIRRVECFGVSLVKLDIRQDSDRHTDVIAEVTRYLGLGDYAQWSEQDKQAFLLQELNNKRPLIPQCWQPSADVKEVLDTFRTVAKQDPESLGIYIISMARKASDVLAVQLLLKETGCPFRLPVAPLFETLDDLNNAGTVTASLLAIDWYKNYINGHQYIMIGYSDSAKDAGVIAASWAQYRSQEVLVDICEKEDIKLTLFHGRGGSIGRGGAPAHAALLSQPPGSLKGGLRVTEQGEMIRFKFGLANVAEQSLNLYTSAILEANLLPPPAPEQSWRDAMDQMSADSCEEYRSYIQGHEKFVPYFRSATPELELGKLPLGSRPAKRKPNGGVESLRAIPWIFAWTQNRLMLPAWLGCTAAFKNMLGSGQRETLQEMQQQWPFFNTRIEMFEMVFLKADAWLAEYYDQCLVTEELWPLGKELRASLALATELIVGLNPNKQLLDAQPWIKKSIELRNPYTDPLNILQAELLSRARSSKEVNPDVEQALMVSIAGVAAGMRNTG